MRLRVIPSNPQTSGQADIRSILGMYAKAAHAVLTSFADSAGVGSPFFTAARDAAPSGQSWISFLQKYSNQDYSDMSSAYTALGATKQGYFDNTATGIGLIAYPGATNNTIGPIAAGGLLFALAYFASTRLSGSIKTLADTAIAGASQGDVDAFGDAVHLTTP